MMVKSGFSGESRFDGSSINDLVREPNRPLGDVSDFVVEQLPNRLEDIRDGYDVQLLVDEIEEKLSLMSLDEKRILFGSEDKKFDIAQLDLWMLHNAVLNSNGKLGKVLKDLTHISSTTSHRPKSLIYSDVVMSNPIGDMRTFTSGTVGYSEALFYLKTRQIEDELVPVINFLNLALDHLIQNRLMSSGDYLNQASLGVKNCAEVMDQLKEMDREHFLELREYLMPLEGLKGISAYFSHGIKQTDLLFAGNRLSSAEPKYFDTTEKELGQGYYAEAERIRRALDIRKEKKSVMDFIEQQEGTGYGPSELYNAALDFSKAILSFRGNHKRIVNKVGLTQGSAGIKDLNPFFDRRMKPYIEVIDRMNDRLEKF